MINDDFSNPLPLAAIGTRWQVFTDQVVGRASRWHNTRETVADTVPDHDGSTPTSGKV
jgi:hypothetical protein